jgi:hypothetical protein
MLSLMRVVAALIVVIVSPAHAQYVGGYAQATVDSAQIDLMKAQTEVLQNYVRCLQTASDSSSCRPPQPIQMPAQNQPTPQNRGGLAQGMLASAQSDLMKAQAQAMRDRADYD